MVFKFIFIINITIASFYHFKFEGRKTVNGDIFSNNNLTAAYNHVPLGTTLKVTNIKNNKSVIIKVNDRCGVSSRIDLSKAAFLKIGKIEQGILKVKIEKIK